MAAEMKPEEGIRSFFTMAQSIGEGQCGIDVNKAAHDLHVLLLKLARAKGMEGVATGQLVLKFKYAVEARGVVGLGYEIDSKAEKPQRSGSPFWLTEGNNLSDTPPKKKQQLSLAGTTAVAVQQEIAAVGAPGGDEDDDEDTDEDAEAL
jgi:hypothetical protein